MASPASPVHNVWRRRPYCCRARSLSAIASPDQRPASAWAHPNAAMTRRNSSAGGAASTNGLPVAGCVSRARRTRAAGVRCRTAARRDDCGGPCRRSRRRSRDAKRASGGGESGAVGRSRAELEQRVAAGRIAVDGMGQLGDGEAPVVRDRALRLAVGGPRATRTRLVAQPRSGWSIVPSPAGARARPRHSAWRPPRPRTARPVRARRRDRARTAARPTCRGRGDAPDARGSRSGRAALHREPGLAAVERRAVNEQPRRLVDRAQPIVAMDDRERRVAGACPLKRVLPGTWVYHYRANVPDVASTGGEP